PVQWVPRTPPVGARFRTGAAPSLLGASAAEFRDHDLALDAVWGATGAALAARVAESDGWRARLEALVDGLLGRIGTARAIDPVRPRIAALIAAEPPRPPPQPAQSDGLRGRHARRPAGGAAGA